MVPSNKLKADWARDRKNEGNLRFAAAKMFEANKCSFIEAPSQIWPKRNNSIHLSKETR
jgi:hypothetical protein